MTSAVLSSKPEPKCRPHKKYTALEVKQRLQMFANHVNPNPTTHTLAKSNKRKFD